VGIIARVLVLVWDIYRCLSMMYLAQAREQLWRRKLFKIIIISIIINYSPWGVHQAILPSTHTSLAGVRTPHPVLTPTRTFSSSFEVATTQQTDGTAHKLKSFHKSAHLRVYSADFHPSMNHAWHYCSQFFCLWLIKNCKYCSSF